MVVAPGSEGEMGILPRHAALLTTLRPGVLRLTKDGNEQILAVGGGFLQVANNRVLVYLAPLTSGMAASLVVGQPDFSHNALNRTGSVTPTIDSLYYPASVALMSLPA